MVKKENYIWVEKYRPIKLEDYISNDTFKLELKKILETGQLNHLMLHGKSPGTGKTTAAKLIAKNIECEYLYLNCSDTNSVDSVRDKIKSFASGAGFSNIKVIICDEADFLTPQAQAALRNIIETYSLNTRFIFTCNYLERISSPIISRCQVFEILPPSKKEAAIHLKNILEKESIQASVDDIGYIVNTYYPDIRKIINFAQQSASDGKLNVIKSNAAIMDVKDKMINILMDGKSTAFDEIRQLIADVGVRHFDDLYKALFDEVGEYAKNNQTVIILIIAEYLYQSSLVVNREITFMACIAKILSEL